MRSRTNIKREFRDPLLQLGVLSFKLAQLLRFRNSHPAELVAPAIESLLRQVVQSEHLANVPRLLRLLQNPNDLFFGKSLKLHLA